MTVTAPATEFASDQLRSIIERIERLEEEKKAISDDITDVYSEAKGNGYDVKALKTIVRERKQDPSDRAEHETILDVYRRALGMLADTPLGAAAMQAATRTTGRRNRSDTRMAG
ncbi:uncharacterized protein (UPF0335 family) [Bradyrhizobium sp. RT10b]